MDEPQRTKGGLVVTHTVNPSQIDHLGGLPRIDVDPREAYSGVDQSKPPILAVSSDAGEGPRPVEQEQVDMGLGPPGAGPKIRQYLSSNLYQISHLVVSPDSWRSGAGSVLNRGKTSYPLTASTPYCWPGEHHPNP